MSNGRQRVLRGAVVALSAGAVGLALIPSAGAAEGRVLGAGAVGAVEGSYLVVLKDSVGIQSGVDVAAEHGAEVTHRDTHALNGFAATASIRRTCRWTAATPHRPQGRV